MPYKVKTEGLDDVEKMITQLGDMAKFVASRSLYEGAGVVADAVNEEARNIQTEPFHYAAVDGVTMRLPSPEEKQILLDNGAMGIAKFEDENGTVETSVGYDGTGYAHVNWNHMSSKARTNYKQQSFKGYDYMTTSTLKFAGTYRRNVQNAKPIGVIANSINSGTSFMKKQPFIRRAITKSTQRMIQAITERAEAMFQQIISENETGGKSA